MQNRYDIRINPKRPSSEQIAKYKDFDHLLEAFQHTPKINPLYKRTWFQLAASISAVFLLAYGYMAWNGMQDYERLQAEYFNQLPYVNPPLPAVQPAFVSFKIKNEEGGRLVHSTGSSLDVPPSAFINSRGEVVHGEVVLKYRELHDFVDFFLAGIPMVYDSAGMLYTLESVGMIEVYAEQNGEQLHLAKDKHIGVELVSRVNTGPDMLIPTGYNVYKLDIEGRNWQYVDVDRISPLDDPLLAPTGQTEPSVIESARRKYAEEIQAIEETHEQKLEELEGKFPMPPKPIQPRKPSPDRYVFELDFSELTRSSGSAPSDPTRQQLARMYEDYGRMLWELSPRSTISPQELQKEFSEVQHIQVRADGNGEYLITLEKDGRKTSFYATPVLTGSDFQQAMQRYREELEAWEKAVAERQAALKQQRAKLEMETAQKKAEAKRRFEEELQRLLSEPAFAEAEDLIIQRKILNRFTIHSTGIWNCDRPLPPYMTQVKASFVNEAGKPYRNLTGYIVDRSRNTLSRFLVKDNAIIRFNMLSDNLLWLVTEEGKLAVCRPDQFNRIDRETKRYTFVLQEVDLPVKNEQDVRKILYL
ncbi:MAG: hypothetical protein KatS3mg030_426 [Saprospiraceae bacterium]|nr:MAG: hypothetical protein KatS3mg030_426 [Saprospiraceae bacterium]